MLKPLLIEIGIEELPAIPFLKELPNINKKWLTILEKFQLISEFEIYYTPRRLVIYHREFREKQPNRVEEFIGAPIEIAYKDGNPTNATIAFAKKCGVEIEKLSKINKNEKEVLYFSKEIEGLNSKELFATMLDEFLKSLSFGKSMRWGLGEESFIRPIRWILGFLDREILDINIFNVQSSNFTFANRSLLKDKIFINSIEEYFRVLEVEGVIIYPELRREKILKEISNLEQIYEIKVEIDSELLDEIVAITEYPTALIGKFDKEFLELPKEVIITSMKEHQRYFAVFKNSEITNNFIVVSNSCATTFNKIISGNEKVLRARLKDGLFFYHNDLKNGLPIDGLKNLLFVDGGGTIFNKIEREIAVANVLFDKYCEDKSLRDELNRAILLNKADLMTQVVYEFPELQGVMGYYYALALGESELVAKAIKEHYLPNREDGELPSNIFSSICAIAYRLDSLFTLFSLNLIPTGSKDPFALRRASIGIIKIVLDKNLNFSIKEILESLKSNYKSFDLEILEQFFIDRLYQIFDVNPSIIKSVINTGERDILEISKKVQSLKIITSSDSFRDIFSSFKRVANITKDLDISKNLEIDENLFEKTIEKELFTKFKTISTKNISSYEEKLDELFGLKDELDNFFDSVLVNAEDLKVRENRKNLIGLVYKEFLTIADIKEIAIV